MANMQTNGTKELPADLQEKAQIVRPNIHITSPLGWLNDPCAPGYDPATGLYHLFYQCNPDGVDWGNMSWGHATSKDLLTWTFNPVHTVLRPDKKYDREGVFTGCLGPLTQKGHMSIFYTSINMLPFHWTNPAPRGSAGLALATSADDGLTWTKSASNPILKEEPEGLNVTGFRDPYLAEWPSFDQIRGTKSLYGLISGGVVGKGPTSFIYAIDPQNIKEWDYIGPLVDMPPRWQPSQKWNCSFGVNWECVNFMTLQAGSVSREFLILGSEGDVAREHLHQKNLPPTVPPRTVRGQQWMAGDLIVTTAGIRMKYTFGGILDHGIYYAANSFHDPVSGRRIVYGWIPEEDCTPEHAHQKGWNGCQAFPRELFLQSIVDVKGALQSSLDEITSIECLPQPDGSLTVYSMGIRPLVEISQLGTSAIATYSSKSISLPSPTNIANQYVATATTPTWHLKSTIKLEPSKCSRVGFYIRHSVDFSTNTTVVFSILDESIMVSRLHSAPQHEGFNSCDETGPFTLYRLAQSSDDMERIEDLELQIISDGDVLEIFANDRFALATMIYSSNHHINCGITAFADGEVGCATFENIKVWDGLHGGKSCIDYENTYEEKR